MSSNRATFGNGGEHPRSLAANPAFAQKIEEGRRRLNGDQVAMEVWASQGCTSAIQAAESVYEDA